MNLERKNVRDARGKIREQVTDHWRERQEKRTQKKGEISSKNEDPTAGAKEHQQERRNTSRSEETPAGVKKHQQERRNTSRSE